MTIKVNTEHENHKWVDVETDSAEYGSLSGIKDGYSEEQALYVLFEQIEAMQAEHAKQLEAAFEEGAGYGLYAVWEKSRAYALIYKDE